MEELYNTYVKNLFDINYSRLKIPDGGLNQLKDKYYDDVTKKKLDTPYTIFHGRGGSVNIKNIYIIGKFCDQDKIPLLLVDIEDKRCNVGLDHFSKIINCDNTLDPGNSFRTTLADHIDYIINEYKNKKNKQDTEKDILYLDISESNYSLSVNGKNIEYSCKYYPLFDIVDKPFGTKRATKNFHNMDSADRTNIYFPRLDSNIKHRDYVAFKGGLSNGSVKNNDYETDKFFKGDIPNYYSNNLIVSLKRMSKFLGDFSQIVSCYKNLDENFLIFKTKDKSAINILQYLNSLPRAYCPHVDFYDDKGWCAKSKFLHCCLQEKLDRNFHITLNSNYIDMRKEEQLIKVFNFKKSNYLKYILDSEKIINNNGELIPNYRDTYWNNILLRFALLRRFNKLSEEFRISATSEGKGEGEGNNSFLKIINSLKTSDNDLETISNNDIEIFYKNKQQFIHTNNIEKCIELINQVGVSKKNNY